MKVLGISTSPRKDGNTATLIKTIFGELEKHGIETELLQVAGQPVRGCRACYACFKNRDHKCVIKDDFINDYIAKMEAADGIILGSPTYFADVNAEMKALIDRVGFVPCTTSSTTTRCSSSAPPTGTWSTAAKSAKSRKMTRGWPTCAPSAKTWLGS